jgi:hypothetical protein
MAICEQLEKAKKSRAVRGNRDKRRLIVPAMCAKAARRTREGIMRVRYRKNLAGCG